MKRQAIGVLALAAALAAALTACNDESGDGSSGSSDIGGVRTSDGVPAPDPASAPNKSTATSAADLIGVVAVTFRGTNGSDRVSCSDIDTEFAVYPESGSVAWTASPRDIPVDLGNHQVRAPLKGVTVSPAQGVLRPGERTVVHVTGTVDAPAKKFWVWVTAPGSTGLLGRDVEFTCGGR